MTAACALLVFVGWVLRFLSKPRDVVDLIRVARDGASRTAIVGFWMMAAGIVGLVLIAAWWLFRNAP